MSEEKQEIKNGDIFDIGQTVNGVSRFVWLSDGWHYFEERLSRKYEYCHEGLSNAVSNLDGLEEIKFLGNIFKQSSQIKLLEEKLKASEEENKALKCDIKKGKDQIPMIQGIELANFRKFCVGKNLEPFFVEKFRYLFDEYLKED